MVIKRSDLEKQFELVVKQEIINHNKSIEQTHKRLNEIEFKIDKIVSESAANASAAKNKFQQMENKSHQLENLSLQLAESITQLKKQQLDMNDEIRFDVSRDIEAIEDNYVEEERFVEGFNLLKRCMNSYENEMDKLRFYVHSELNSLKLDCKQWIDDFKQKIDDRPSELPALKEELQARIDQAKVDAAGVLKSIHVTKKDMFVMKKEIEDLYNKLKKLQPKVSP